MNGEIKLSIWNKFIKYQLSFKHNISIILGDSGSGKTNLCNFIRNAARKNAGIQYKIAPSYDIYVMTSDQEWEIVLQNMHNTLIFFDEDMHFTNTKKFANIIRHTDNYYVIISRDALKCLPYSVNAIYELKSSGKFMQTKPIIVYNTEFFNIEQKKCFYPDIVITEDSGTGLEFFTSMYHDISVVSSDGNIGIFRKVLFVLGQGHKNLLVIIDGAAFGPYISELVAYLQKNNIAVLLALPESFEWILLHHTMFAKDNNILSILQTPESYIDYSLDFSLEQYFRRILANACIKFKITYDKGRQLHKAFLTEKMFKITSSLLSLPYREASTLEASDSSSNIQKSNFF